MSSKAAKTPKTRLGLLAYAWERCFNAVVEETRERPKGELTNHCVVYDVNTLTIRFTFSWLKDAAGAYATAREVYESSPNHVPLTHINAICFAAPAAGLGLSGLEEQEKPLFHLENIWDGKLLTPTEDAEELALFPDRAEEIKLRSDMRMNVLTRMQEDLDRQKRVAPLPDLELVTVLVQDFHGQIHPQWESAFHPDTEREKLDEFTTATLDSFIFDADAFVHESLTIPEGINEHIKQRLVEKGMHPSRVAQILTIGQLQELRDLVRDPLTQSIVCVGGDVTDFVRNLAKETREVVQDDVFVFRTSYTYSANHKVEIVGSYSPPQGYRLCLNDLMGGGGVSLNHFILVKE
jgi:hypothetical protein